MSRAVLDYLDIASALDAAWLAVGLAAQAMFSARFLIQWITSERRRASVIPPAFWYFSLAGGVLLLAYGVHRGEPVIILGQIFGIVVYARNLWLLHAAK